MSALDFCADVPDPSMHAAFVLRSGTRYVGHVVKVDTSREPVQRRIVTFSEGSRRILINFDEVAAIETFGGEFDSPTVCEVCRDNHVWPTETL